MSTFENVVVLSPEDVLGRIRRSVEQLIRSCGEESLSEAVRRGMNYELDNAGQDALGELGDMVFLAGGAGVPCCERDGHEVYEFVQSVEEMLARA